MLSVGVGIGSGRRGSDPGNLRPAVAGGLVVYDPSRMDSLFQLSNGTTPVTAFGQPVGRLSDRSGNGIHAVQGSADLRPLYALVEPASFRDAFDRANTSAGDLGIAPTGQVWDLRGAYTVAYPLPASSFGQITDGRFVVPGGQIVYAGVDTGSAPVSITCKWSWSDRGTGTEFTTLAVLCSPSVNWIDTMLHVTITNTTIRVQKRINGGSFIDMNAGNTAFGAPSLALGNTLHTLRLDIDGNTVRARVDDTRYDVTVTDSDIPAIVGRHLVCEHYSGTTNVRWPMDIRGFEAQLAADTARPARPALVFDRVDDNLAVMLPAATYTVAYGRDAGVTILTGVVHGGGAYTLPTTQRTYGMVIIDRALTDAETAGVTAWLNSRRP